MSNETNGARDLSMLEIIADNYLKTIEIYANKLPQSESAKLYHTSLAMYFAAARDLLNSANPNGRTNYANY